MFPARYDIRIKQGSTFYRKITVRNKKTGVLTNFTSYHARMAIKSKVGGETLVFLSTENGGITLSAQGVIELKISPENSKKLKFETCVYDLDLISSSNEVYTYLEGVISVSLGVTI